MSVTLRQATPRRAPRRRHTALLVSLFLAAAALCACCNGDGRLVGESYTAQLTVHLLEPTLGPTAGGTIVRIVGENFGPDAEVFFGGVPATTTELHGHSLLIVETPPALMGSADVRVRSGGREADAPDGFRYHATEVQLALDTVLGPHDPNVAFASGRFGDDEHIWLAAVGDGQVELAVPAAPLRSNLVFPLPGGPQTALAKGACTGTTCFLSDSVAAVDWGGDGRDELFVIPQGTTTAYVAFLLGDSPTSAPSWQSIELESVVDRCHFQALLAADLDRDGHDDLLVVNHTSHPVRSPALPGSLGTVGVVYGPGSATRPAARLALPVDCDRFHSLAHTSDTEPPVLALLCSARQGEKDDLYQIDIEAHEGGPRLSASPVSRQLDHRSRYHVAELGWPHDRNEFVRVLERGDTSQSLFPELSVLRTGVVSRPLVQHTQSMRSTFPLLLIAPLIEPKRSDVLAFSAFDPAEFMAYSSRGWTLDPSLFLFSGPATRELLWSYTLCNGSARDEVASNGIALDLTGDGLAELVAHTMDGHVSVFYPQRHSKEKTVTFDRLPPYAGGPDVGPSLGNPIPSQLYVDGVPTGLRAELLPGEGTSTILLTANLDARKLAATTDVRLLDNGEFDTPSTKPELDVLVLTPDSDGRLLARAMRTGDALTEMSGGTPPAPLSIDPLAVKHSRTLVEDIDETPGLDLVLVRHGGDNATFLEFLPLSERGFEPTVTHYLDRHRLQGVQRVARDRTDALRFVAYYCKSASHGTSHNGESCNRYDARLYAGTPETRFRVSSRLFDDLLIPGGVLDIVDLDRDGALDLVARSGDVCWGAGLSPCPKDGPGLEPFFNIPPSSPARIVLTYQPQEDAFEAQLYFDSAEPGLRFAVDGRELRQVASSLLYPAWYTIETPPEDAEAGCDLDGDGRVETLRAFLYTSATRSSGSGNTGWDWGWPDKADKPDPHWETSLGHSHRLSGIIGCLDLEGRGVDDVLVLDRYERPRLVRNISR